MILVVLDALLQSGRGWMDGSGNRSLHRKRSESTAPPVGFRVCTTKEFTVVVAEQRRSTLYSVGTV